MVAGKRGELIKERGRGVVCSFRIELGFAIEWKRLSLLISLVRIPIFLFFFLLKAINRDRTINFFTCQRLSRPKCKLVYREDIFFKKTNLFRRLPFRPEPVTEWNTEFPTRENIFHPRFFLSLFLSLSLSLSNSTSRNPYERIKVAMEVSTSRLILFTILLYGR